MVFNKLINNLFTFYLYVYLFIYPCIINTVYQFINCMKQSLCLETDGFPVSQETSCILLNPNIVYRIYETATLVPVMSETRKVHAFLLCLLKIHFNIIFSY
jgi:hypothetical protein